MTKKPPTVKFSPAEKKAIQSCARAVWDYIGYDCLVATCQDKYGYDTPVEKNIDRVSMPRSHVIEVVMDAGRLEDEMHGSERNRAKHRPNEPAIFTPDFFARWQQGSYEQEKRIVRAGFTYARYGT